MTTDAEWVGKRISLPNGAGQVTITSVRRFADNAVLVEGDYKQLFAGSFWDSPADMAARGIRREP